MDPQIKIILNQVANRCRSYRLAWTFAAFWIALACAFWLGLLPSVDQVFDSPQLFWREAILIGLIGLLLWFASRFAFRDFHPIAQRIEARFPTLEQRLLTATQLSSSQSSHFLRRKLIDETVTHSRVYDWREIVSSKALLGAWVAQWLVLLALVGWFVSGLPGASRPLAATAPVANGIGSELKLFVEPGDIDLERGTDLLITSKIEGAVDGDLPRDARLVIVSENGEETTLEMSRALADPIFGATLRRVEMPVTYRVEVGSIRSDDYAVRLFEFPALVQSDAAIDSPSYARRETRMVEDTRRVTVVDGSKLRWSMSVNKPLASAMLVDEEGNETKLIQNSVEPLKYEAAFEMDQTKRWKLKLLDIDSRGSKWDEELVAKVIPNKPAELKLSSPSDLRVSAIQEVLVGAKIQDDFGIHRSGLTYSLGEDQARDIVLFEEKISSTSSVGEASASEAVQKQELNHRIDLENLKASPDQLLSYYFWTEDIDRDGQVRRVDGDMFFAEIRPFEELYREGDSSAAQQRQQQQSEQSGASQNAQQAEDLAELQKKLMTATWNTIRKVGLPNQKIDNEEIDVLIESQDQALQQTAQLAEQLQDEKSIGLMKGVQEAMTKAVTALDKVKSNQDALSLRDALSNERSAYEGLLKLRAREHSIVQSQQQQSQSRSQSSSQRNRQQQIEQLKLDDQQNRYESESRPQEEANPADREMRQVMSRLDELARRQQDLNEQIRELDLALREAKEEAEKKELEEQLKTLRDNQEELLRDTDELLERMDREDNRQAMEASREQVQDAREQLKQSNQSLASGETSPALASGTRAQQKMEETRESLRQESAEGLQESVRDLLREAKAIESQQLELERKLSGEAEPTKSDGSPASVDALNSSSLRPDAETGESTKPEDWKAQRQGLEKLYERIQDTVLESESSEPLLADALYDSFKDAKGKGIEQRLEQIPQMLSRGLDAPARQAAQEVSSGITELRERLEKSSESVLGSEQQALRRAINELERARGDLEGEIRDRTDDTSGERRGSPTNGRPTESGNAEEGEQNEADPSGARSRASGSEQGSTNPDALRTADRDREGSGQDRTQPDSEQQPGPQQRGSGQRGETQPSENQARQGQSGGQQARSPREVESQRSDAQAEDAPVGEQKQGEQKQGEQSGGRQPGDQLRGDRQGAQVGSGGERSTLDRIATEREFRAPLTGDDFLEWSDRIRDVEELVRDPDLRAEAARIREAAREMRVEFKRHSKEPQWPLVKKMIAEPLDQLQQKITEELLRKSAERNQIIPIDRDPVPNQFRRKLDKYYESLGDERTR